MLSVSFFFFYFKKITPMFPIFSYVCIIAYWLFKCIIIYTFFSFIVCKMFQHVRCYNKYKFINSKLLIMQYLYTFIRHFLSFIQLSKLLRKFTLEVHYFNMYLIPILVLDIIKYNIIDLPKNKWDVYLRIVEQNY